MGRLLLFALVACGSDPVSPKAPETTFLAFTSDPGDFIGLGQSHRYAVNDGSWRVDYGGHRLSILFDQRAQSGVWWSLQVFAPSGKTLSTGTYAAAQRTQYETGPGLDFSGSRVCTTVAGQFVIKYLELGPDNTINRLHLTFEQHCDGAAPALHGEVALVANPWR